MSKSKSNCEYIKVSSPSNIAFVKYWGKFGDQLPINPSISMTLNKCISIFEIHFKKKIETIVSSFHFENKQNNLFKSKIETFLSKNIDSFPILKDYSIDINCSNTFPHSSGIASSASSMSALVYALGTFQQKKGLRSLDLGEMSSLARLASGSASRSLFPKMAFWGESSLEKASNLHATLFKDIAEVFEDLHDAILLLDKGEKQVSSSAGHKLMSNHPFKSVRIKQAQANLIKITESLKDGDLEAFGKILEEEALTLHSLMMTSDPSFILMKPNSLKAIELIREFRIANSVHCYFTMDAGANIHLIYPKLYKNEVENFIEKKLKPLCENQEVIYDKIGYGPEVIEVNIE